MLDFVQLFHHKVWHGNVPAQLPSIWGVRLNDHFILLRKPLEVYDLETDKSFSYKTLDEALRHVIDGITIAEIIRNATPDSLFSLVLDGGRGGDSDGWEGGFSHADDKGNEKDKSWEDFPARANHQIRAKNTEEALKAFRLATRQR